jgi:hypothetical protein
MDALWTLLAFTLDPVRVLITLTFVLLARNRWRVLTAAALSALVCETLLMTLQTAWIWGEGLAVGGFASLLQALILYGVGTFFRNWRTSGVAPFHFPFRT